MLERLNALKSRKHLRPSDLIEALKRDSGLRNEVNSLSRYFLGRSVSGCSNCFFDAYMELVNLKNMEEKTKFKLRRGVVLYDPVNLDAGKMLTSANCTDELALYHLKFNPNCRKHFHELPDDVEELIKSYQTGTPTTKKAGNGTVGTEGTAGTEGTVGTVGTEGAEPGVGTEPEVAKETGTEPEAGADSVPGETAASETAAAATASGGTASGETAKAKVKKTKPSPEKGTSGTDG
jgi:hypothetical protein